MNRDESDVSTDGNGFDSTLQPQMPVKDEDAPLVIPVLEEQVVVSKRTVVAGRVRLSKRVHRHDESVNETVLVQRADIERTPIHRIVDTAPDIRYEGDTMVISVVEEVLVVEKRLLLREEIRVSRRQVAQHINERVTVRTEEITVERFDDERSTQDGDDR